MKTDQEFDDIFGSDYTIAAFTNEQDAIMFLLKWL